MIRAIIYIVLSAFVLSLGTAFWVYGTIEPCSMLAKEFRKDIIIQFEDGDQVTDEDMRDGERRVDEAISIAVKDYSRLECTDKLLAFWFFEDPYQE